jgi:hypothetical protein
MNAATGGFRASIGALAVWIGCTGCGGDDPADPGGNGAAGPSSGSGAGASAGQGGSGGAGGGGHGGGAADPGPPCLPGGFCLEFPQLTDADLLDVHGSSANDVWAVGLRGTALRSVDGGATWARRGTGVDVALRSVFVAAPDDAWAVGDAGTVLHWDGTAWTAVDAGTAADLRDIAVAADGSLWIAGAGDEGLLLRGVGGVFAAVDTAGCGDLRTVVVRESGEVVAGGAGSSFACLARIIGDDVTVEQLFQVYGYSTFAFRVLEEIAGELWGIASSFGDPLVVHAIAGDWQPVHFTFHHDIPDIAPRPGGSVWMAGPEVKGQAEVSCAAPSPGYSEALWTSPDGSLIAVGRGGFAAKLDLQTACAHATSFQAPIGQSLLVSELPAVDGQGTPWFLVGDAAWELRDGAWQKAFEVPISWNGYYADHVSSFAVCGDGTARLIANHYLGDDVNGPVYYPVGYRWERGQAAVAEVDDVPQVIEAADTVAVLDDLRCEPTGGEWYGYSEPSLAGMHWAPRAALVGQVPSALPECRTADEDGTALFPGGSPFFLRAAYTVLVPGDPTYYQGALMVFEGDTCRVLSSADWPALPSYVTVGEGGAVELGDSQVAGGTGLGDVWLRSQEAILAALAGGELELAHLAGGAWSKVLIPLPSEVHADLAAIDTVPDWRLRPLVTSADGLVLVSVDGAETRWLLLVEGDVVHVVRGEDHPFGDYGGRDAHHFASQGKLRTLELPGIVFARPL